MPPQAAARPVFPVPHRRAAWLLALTLCVGSAAQAQTWNEIGDAGDLPGKAQTTVGGGPLTTIKGTLSAPADVDLYCIQVSDLPRALDIPVVRLVCTAQQSPNVWLFDVTGLGISASSLCAAGFKTLTTTTVGPLATYLVAVSYADMMPASAIGTIWQLPSGIERTADGPGAAGALNGWMGTPVVQGPNPYQIQLDFTAYCDDATPTTGPTWGSLKVRYSD